MRTSGEDTNAASRKVKTPSLADVSSDRSVAKVQQAVAIVVLNWNGLDDTVKCLEYLQKVVYPHRQIILVDNGSTDGSAARLKAKYPDFTFIENEKNLGFAEGNNVGIRHALTKNVGYVLILNNDAVVPSDFLSNLISVAEKDPEIGIVGPKVVYHDDPTKIWSAGGKIGLFTARFSNVGDHESRASCHGARTVDYVSGCALLIKNEVIQKIGLLDQDFFLYLDEADWNYRAHQQGYRSVVDCNTTVLHKVGASSSATKDLIYYYFARNSLLFLHKHGRWYHCVTFVPCYALRYGLMFAWNFVRGNRTRCEFIVSGMRDYFKASYGVYPSEPCHD